MPDFGRWTSNGGDPSLNEINRTDRFLDALASEQPVYSTDPGEAELAYLLAGWRDEHRVPPAKALVTQRDAVAALNRGTRQRTRFSMAVLGSVAAAVLCLGGFGAVVAGAGPGDALYGLRTMLFGEQQVTRDDQVVLAAQTELAEVQQLIEQGQWDAAQDKLAAVTTTVATVDDVARKQELVDQWQELSVKVETKDANATVPPDAPPATLPPAAGDRGIVCDGNVFDDHPHNHTVVGGIDADSDADAVELPTPTPSTDADAVDSDSDADAGARLRPPAPSTPIPTPAPSTPLPTPAPSTPIPTPAPSTPLPDAGAVDPDSDARRRRPRCPTPAPSTPIPTPAPSTPIPTPTPLPTPSSTVVATPLPTPTGTTPRATPQPTPSAQPPILEAPAPRTVTTTIVVPAAPGEPR